MIVLTDENFEAFSKKAFCIVFTHKPNCPHCKILRTVINKVVPNYNDIPVASIDSTTSQGLMETIGADRVPTLLIFNHGKVIAKKTGIMNPQEMKQFISGARSDGSK
jgi:thioredoxin-like negative regulator of GroEL